MTRLYGIFGRRRGHCKYAFPHSDRFPKNLYWQHPEKSWIYMKEWDGTWHQDVNQLAQTDEFKEQLQRLRRIT